MPSLTVLIPLDTTPFAESSLLLLPMLKTLGFDKARLLSVWDPQQKRPSDIASGPEALESYLVTQAQAISNMGYEVETTVRQGKAAETSIAAAGEPDVDLVLLSTHGRTGITRLRLGSVGDRIIKESPTPRLVVGPNIDVDLSIYSLTRILLPLDASELSETALPIAKHIADLSGAEIELLRCVSVLTAGGPEAMAAGVDILSVTVDEANAYLDRISQTLAGRQVSSTVLVGAPAQTILEHIRNKPVDLVIMASRGRTGLGRMAMGSVTESVLHGPDPVLVFEPGEDKGRFVAAARATS